MFRCFFLLLLRFLHFFCRNFLIRIKNITENILNLGYIFRRSYYFIQRTAGHYDQAEIQTELLILDFLRRRVGNNDLTILLDRLKHQKSSGGFQNTRLLYADRKAIDILSLLSRFL